MFYSGWDTDDLTNRQHYVFCKLNNNSTSGITITALREQIFTFSEQRRFIQVICFIHNRKVVYGRQRVIYVRGVN